MDFIQSIIIAVVEGLTEIIPISSTGHMIIASHMVQYTDLSQVWMVVSPQNPFKQKSSLARGSDRLHLVRLAIGDHPNIVASSVEFSLPVPSFTTDTLAYLKEKYPDRTFSLIMGQDNFETLEKWKNYEYILSHHEIYIYPRPGHQPPASLSGPAVYSEGLRPIGHTSMCQCVIPFKMHIFETSVGDQRRLIGIVGRVRVVGAAIGYNGLAGYPALLMRLRVMRPGLY